MIQFQLTKPIHFGEEVITELSIKEPVAADYRGVNVGSQDPAILLDFAAKLSGKAPSVIGMLCNKDTFRLIREINRFLDEGLEATNDA